MSISITAHSERAALWQARFRKSEQAVFRNPCGDRWAVAGFACVFLNEDPIFGSFLDNLHVTPERTGRELAGYSSTMRPAASRGCRRSWPVPLGDRAEHQGHASFIRGLARMRWKTGTTADA